LPAQTGAPPQHRLLPSSDPEPTVTQAAKFVVAVPVRNEAERLAACLHALAHQAGGHEATLVVLVNNSSDGSAAIARRFAASSPVPVVVRACTLKPAEAHAGGARRRAMALAAALARDDAVLFTTDADGRVAPDWLAANLAALAAGADAVAGQAAIDPADELQIPLPLRQADAAECGYAALLDEIAARIDPDPADPWPRHDEHSGASIAVTADAYRRVGGIPLIATGEDRGFFDALRRIDARIRHAPDVRVTVSGRLDGRAAGGMAETIRRRMLRPDMFLDARLDSARRSAARAWLRRRTRLVWAATRVSAAWPMAAERAVTGMACAFGLPRGQLAEILASPHFGAAWQALEAGCTALQRQKVAASEVLRETAIARGILRGLRPAGTQSSSGMSSVALAPIAR
jgi:GT2 family glycosyltransferase